MADLLVLSGDYASILTNLLRYPPDAPELPLSASVLLEQADKIRQDPSPATGAAISLQNFELLGIRPYVPLPTDEEPIQQRRRPMAPTGSSARGNGGYGQGYGFEGIAKGLIERAQSSGIDRAIISRVSELRKNLPELAASAPTSFQFRTFSPASTEGISPEGEPSSGSGRSLMDAEREIAELRLVMVGMAKAMSRWTDVAQTRDASDEDRRSAWQGLSRLQASLQSGAYTASSELAREWTWSESLEPSRSALLPASPFVKTAGGIAASEPSQIAAVTRSLEAQSVDLPAPSKPSPGRRVPLHERLSAMSASASPSRSVPATPPRQATPNPNAIETQRARIGDGSAIIPTNDASVDPLSGLPTVASPTLGALRQPKGFKDPLMGLGIS